MIKYIKWFFNRTKVFTASFRKYKFYHLTDVNNDMDFCIDLIKILMGNNIIFIVESENEIDVAILKKTKLKLLNYEYNDNHIYSFYGDVNRLIIFTGEIIRHLNSLFAINFLKAPSGFNLKEANYSNLQTEKLIRDNIIDSAITLDFYDHQIIIEVSKNNSETIEIINGFIKKLKKQSNF